MFCDVEENLNVQVFTCLKYLANSVLNYCQKAAVDIHAQVFMGRILFHFLVLNHEVHNGWILWYMHLSLSNTVKLFSIVIVPFFPSQL